MESKGYIVSFTIKTFVFFSKIYILFSINSLGAGTYPTGVQFSCMLPIEIVNHLGMKGETNTLIHFNFSFKEEYIIFHLPYTAHGC